ncbi:MAG: hypothetical protein H7X80_07800 [bacterium]|nr:hypothetical protein [Candidatus Kapabacteria bacterium]
MTEGLADDEAQSILSWAENHLAACENEGDALRLLDSVRLLSRYVQEGGLFDHLFTALKANTAPRSSVVPEPGDLDSSVETIYPTDL